MSRVRPTSSELLELLSQGNLRTASPTHHPLQICPHSQIDPKVTLETKPLRPGHPRPVPIDDFGIEIPHKSSNVPVQLDGGEVSPDTAATAHAELLIEKSVSSVGNEAEWRHGNSTFSKMCSDYCTG
jgi:hypothetical protein